MENESRWRPVFITFTGLDDRTDVVEALRLSSCYPVEWGVLLSPKNQGRFQRYPTDPYRFVGRGLRLAAHLCGKHSRDVLAGQSPEVDLRGFERVQINHTHHEGTWDEPIRFEPPANLRYVIPVRSDAFPDDASVDWLFDPSGGAGLKPHRWPPHPGRLVGYAGGIGPDNVRAVVEQIAASGPYWIDMESGVRTEEWLDLEKCRRVCEAVYGALPE